MSRAHPKVLLVEGKDEVFTLPELLEKAGLDWPSKDDAPVWIEKYDGIEALLEQGAIDAQLSASGRDVVGIVIDANAVPAKRWQRIRALPSRRFRTLPQDLPGEGLVHSAPGLPRVGVWLMPDNLAPGMLETMMLHRLRDRSGEDLTAHVRDSVVQARRLAAPLRDCHMDKGELHTWLAWQDPPGLQMHMAVRAGLICATDEMVAPFVDWFRRRFSV